MVRYDKPSRCEVCSARIDFAGSGYVTEANEMVCEKCISILRGSRDDQSYISVAEKIRNSNGMVILQ